MFKFIAAIVMTVSAIFTPHVSNPVQPVSVVGRYAVANPAHDWAQLRAAYDECDVLNKTAAYATVCRTEAYDVATGK